MIFKSTFQLKNKINFLIGSILIGILKAEIVYAKGLSLTITGQENNTISNTFNTSLVNFNVTLFAFGGGREGENDVVVKIDVSGDEETFKLIASSNQDITSTTNFNIKGVFGETNIEGGNTIMSNAWWDYSFDFALDDFDSKGSLINIDSIRVSNGTIQHLEDPHTGDAEEGVTLGPIPSLKLFALDDKTTDTVSMKNKICEPHPGINHEDCIDSAKLSIDIDDGFLGNDITNWNFTVTASHSVPEPLTILGAGTAIAFGTGFKRKLAKTKKK